MRSNGAPSVGSPRTSASAVSTRWLPFETSRSNPMAANMPHLVGIRVETTRQRIPAWAAALMFVRLAIFLAPIAEGLRVHSKPKPLRYRFTFLCFRYGAARVQAVDFVHAES